MASHPRSIVVLLDTRTAGTSREIFSEEFLCPVEPLYFSDEKSITDEK